MSERVNRLLHASPAISNDPKMILAAAAEEALIKRVDPVDQAQIAGFVVVLAFKDGTVSSMGVKNYLAVHLSNGDAKRAMQYALYAAVETKIGNRNELD